MNAANYPRATAYEYASAILHGHAVIAESRAQVRDIRRELGGVRVLVTPIRCAAHCQCGISEPSYQVEAVR